MLAKSVELEVAIDAAQQVRAGNMVIKVEGVEECVLLVALMPIMAMRSSRSINQE